MVLDVPTTIAEACRLYDLTPSEVESCVDDGQRGLENALRARPQDVRDEFETKVKDLQAKVGELVLERDALISSRPRSTRPRDGKSRAGRNEGRGEVGNDDAAVSLVRRAEADDLLPIEAT